ncbi:acyl-CoA dehydrogenase family protein [Sabulicella rubraurantiaca]|uniref:acyl-CoA dehydrogenase family protein n=1 Tax=Sabulicella rubraurantiaca TaxID=2811429 RepID=UPI001A971102|nr:acyl-CoA dehydrogenase family protein [Sabulicella rubraurantiaca]
MKDAEEFLNRTRQYASELAAQRAERQSRRALDPPDFSRLREIGFLHASVPVEHGGWWEGTSGSIRTLSEAFRLLGSADPSIALSASMHPGVLAFWRDTPPPADDAGGRAWAAQKREISASTLEGHWWGTITSEPGSGSDISKTRATARRDPASPAGWLLTGEKHFGSGSGVTSFMITSARPEGEIDPSWFFMRVKGAPWDGTTGMALRARWDGQGMAATDSHGFVFENFPATRYAWPGHWREILEGPGGSVAMVQVAVIVGIVDAAMDYMRTQLRARGAPSEPLLPFEKIEWVIAHREAWLVQQAFEAGLRILEEKGRARFDTSMAKSNIATLSEMLLGRLCRVAGGGAYSRRSPLGHWFEDVRAMGYLRPPWALAFEALYNLGWANALAEPSP